MFKKLIERLAQKSKRRSLKRLRPIVDKYGALQVDHHDSWKLTIPNHHIHVDLTALDVNALSHKDQPLSAEGKTFREAAKKLLNLSKMHVIGIGNVCQRGCKNYFEF